MSRFSLSRKVTRDLEAIWDYLAIEKNSPAAAERALEQLYERFSLLANQPLLGEVRDDLAEGIRAFASRPFIILYCVKRPGIQIVRVVHSAQDIAQAFWQP